MYYFYAQRVDEIDTLNRQTKMDADEEARRRQYKGTAMSDDEVRKVYKKRVFGALPKTSINKVIIIGYFLSQIT